MGLELSPNFSIRLFYLVVDTILMEDDSFLYNYAPYQTMYGDVWISIGVFSNYIQYNTECPWCWIDCWKFYYRVDGEKLYVKAFEFWVIDYWIDYEKKTFFFLQNWEMNTQVVNEYMQWHIQQWDNKGNHEY